MVLREKSALRVADESLYLISIRILRTVRCKVESTVVVNDATSWVESVSDIETVIILYLLFC